MPGVERSSPSSSRVQVRKRTVMKTMKLREPQANGQLRMTRYARSPAPWGFLCPRARRQRQWGRRHRAVLWDLSPAHTLPLPLSSVTYGMWPSSIYSLPWLAGCLHPLCSSWVEVLAMGRGGVLGR